jgi:anti-sigma factor RsiW
MNCVRFARILADYNEGKLPAEERAAAEEHLDECPSCRKLLEVATGGVDILPEEMREGLTLSILEHTSGGPVCPRVESSLWEFAGGELSSEESHLTALHLDHCAGCRSMAADLAAYQSVLPAMAEIDPGETFAREVVRITSGKRTYRPDVRTRLEGWWNRIVQRPRFALEAAYVCTLPLIFALSPLLPFRDLALQTIPSKALYPSAKYAASIWMDAKAPLSIQAQKVASAAASGDRAVSATLGGLAKRSARASSYALNESLQRIGGWNLKEAADLARFWDRLSGWIPRNKS